MANCDWMGEKPLAALSRELGVWSSLEVSINADGSINRHTLQSVKIGRHTTFFLGTSLCLDHPLKNAACFEGKCSLLQLIFSGDCRPGQRCVS